MKITCCMQKPDVIPNTYIASKIPFRREYQRQKNDTMNIKILRNPI